jgi:hypothetical protein
VQRRQPQAFRLAGALRGRDIERREGPDLALATRDRLGAEIDDGACRDGAGFDAAGEIERGLRGLSGIGNGRVLHGGSRQT